MCMVAQNNGRYLMLLSSFVTAFLRKWGFSELCTVFFLLDII